MLENNLVALTTVAALSLFVWMGLRVGQARAKFGVAAPATVGHPEFERHFRVQANTLEGLVVFLPSLWIFAFYWGQTVATVIGLVWIAGRIVYMLAYVRDPAARSTGFMIQGAALVLLLLGIALGAVRMMIVKGSL